MVLHDRRPPATYWAGLLRSGSGQGPGWPLGQQVEIKLTTVAVKRPQAIVTDRFGVAPQHLGLARPALSRARHVPLEEGTDLAAVVTRLALTSGRRETGARARLRRPWPRGSPAPRASFGERGLHGRKVRGGGRGWDQVRVGS
jgi:hypothetical protein